MSDWAVRYIGRSFTECGGCDGLYATVTNEVFGSQVIFPQWSLATATKYDEVMECVSNGQWHKIDEPVAGDAVLLFINPEMHVGVWCGRGDDVLHVFRGGLSAIHSLKRIQSTLKAQLIGYYRWNGRH